MESWFTVDKIDETTYAISEYRHYEHTHAYLLIGARSALLIDTGLGVSDISGIVSSLTNLNVLAVATHAHWDHIGGHALFPHFAVYAYEEAWLTKSFPLPLDVVKSQLLKEPCAFPPGFDADDYRLFIGTPCRILHDLATFELGDRLIYTLQTPGHSPGHMCFYEPEREYLYTGDLAYMGCLDAYYPTTNPAKFARSVARVARLKIKRILSAHHALNVPIDLLERIDETFSVLSKQNLLHHGAGTFSFSDFQIRL
ncbi:MAG TPA: MBL fold metallo-hydrolase [Clostridia bacterium]|nr:MBL fold metallo-hydrolase [Clostridia bacterium]